MAFEQIGIVESSISEQISTMSFLLGSFEPDIGGIVDPRFHSESHLDDDNKKGSKEEAQRPASPSWWLMTPATQVNGSDADAETEFLEDANQLNMEMEIQTACCLDPQTTKLLQKFGEPLRSTVMANIERSAAYLRYRNQLGIKFQSRDKDRSERGTKETLMNAGSMAISSAKKTEDAADSQNRLNSDSHETSAHGTGRLAKSITKSRTSFSDAFGVAVDASQQMEGGVEESEQMDEFLKEAAFDDEDEEGGGPVVKKSNMSRMTKVVPKSKFAAAAGRIGEEYVDSRQQSKDDSKASSSRKKMMKALRTDASLNKIDFP